MNRRLGVLISGRGSNLQAIIDAIDSGHLDASIAVVISNKPGAVGLTRALAAGLPTEVLDHKAFASRRDYDLALAASLRRHGVGLVCLAGFMRLLGPEFVEAFPNAVLNVHPSLLPAFPGVNAQRQALEHGVKVAGCTVHVVTADLDAGRLSRRRRFRSFRPTRSRPCRRASSSRSIACIRKRSAWYWQAAGRSTGGGSCCRHDRLRPDRRVRLAQARRRQVARAALRSVSTATSGGQLMRTGT